MLWTFHNYEPFIFTHQGATGRMACRAMCAGWPIRRSASSAKPSSRTAEARIAAAKLNKSQKAKLRKDLRYTLDKYFKSPQRTWTSPSPM